MPIVRLTRTATAGGNNHMLIDAGRDGSLAMLSLEGSRFLTRFGEDGTEQLLLAAPARNDLRFSQGFETLSDGRYVAYYNNGGGDVFLQIFNRDGSEATPLLAQGNDGQGPAQDVSIFPGFVLAPTLNGGFTVAFDDFTRAGEHFPITFPQDVNGQTSGQVSAQQDVRVRFHDAAGLRTGPSTVSDDDVETVNGVTVSRRAGQQFINDAETLTDGATVIVYEDIRHVGFRSGGSYNREYVLSAQIIRPGNVGEPFQVDLGTFGEITGDNPNAIARFTQANVVALPDGGFAVLWNQQVWQPAPVFGGYEFAGTSSLVRYYTADGTALTGAIQFAFRGTELGNISNVLHAEALSDGRIAVAYNVGRDGSNGSGQVDATLTLLGVRGATIETTRANPTASVDGQRYGVFDLAVRSDDTIELVYNDASPRPDGSGINRNLHVVERFAVGDPGEVVVGGAETGETIAGGLGADTIFGNGGEDVISGAGGNDSLQGGAGNDRIDGGEGRDRLFGNADNDQLFGGGDNDVLGGGAGNDVLDGGTGTDTAVFGGTRAGYTLVNLGGGQVRVTGPDGTDTTAAVEQLQFANVTVAVPTSIFEQTLYQAASNFGAGPAGGGWASYGDFPRVVGDINGDGRADIIGFGAAGTYVSLGQANGTFGAVTQVNSQFGQSDGGGGWSSFDRFPRMVADVNGDGRADIVGFGDAGTYVALANGSGGFGALALAVSNFGTTAGGWSSQNLYHRTMGDVNGDGRADIIGFGEAGTYVALGAANGSFAAPTLAVAQFGRGGDAGGWTSHDLYARMVGDINNDGRADLIGFGNAGTYVALGNANGTFGSLALAIGEFGTATGWSSQDRYPRMIADVNGDGFDDIVGFGEAGVYYALNNGAGGFGTVSLGYAHYANGAGGWASSNRYPRLLGDVNGDGLADIIGFGENGVFVTLADGFDVVVAQASAGDELLASEVSGDTGHGEGDVSLLFEEVDGGFGPADGAGRFGMMSAFQPERVGGEGHLLIFEEFGGQLHVLNGGGLEDLTSGVTFIV